jgi:selenocysteine lyase/cysteine desulfurase
MRSDAGKIQGFDATVIPDWDSFRSQFPVVRDYIYFNHAAIAPISRFLKERVSACMEKYCTQGIVCNSEFLEIVEETRRQAAKVINSHASDIAFVKNTTQGLLLAANGIDWKQGDNVVIPDKEFPANVFPWLALTSKGVEVRSVPLKNGRFTVDDIARCVDGRTRVISVSAVSFLDGFRCNLGEIGRFCEEKHILFVVDAIQALGAVDLDVKACRIDVLSADGHKWLLGPQGVGIAYVSEKALDTLAVSNMGWMSMTEESDHLRYDIRLRPDAGRFEEGTLNIFGIVGLKAAIDMLLNIGLPIIHNRILELLDLLVIGLEEKGYQIRSSMKRNERSGIISFSHKELATADIYEGLFRANVVCALRDNAVRISPHFYNNSTDIEKFLDALH